jgi:hypothetical protein
MVYSGKKQSPSVEQNTTSKETSRAQVKEGTGSVPLIPPGEITIKMTNVKIDERPFSMNSKIFLTPSKLGLKKTTFAFSKGKGTVDATVNISKSKTNGNFSFDLKEFDLIGLKPFLPKNVLKAITGTFSGKTDGSFSMMSSKVKYDVFAKLSAQNGEIKGVKISDYIKPIITKIPSVGKKYSDKVVDVDGKFKTLSLNGRFLQNKYTIKNYRFIGLGKNVDLSGNGYISPIPTGKSEMYATYRDPNGKITKVLKKEAGTDKLMLKLKGKGFSLKPDINYTLSKLSKTAVKTQGKKQLDKFLKDDKNKKKLNKLFKGLFK